MSKSKRFHLHILCRYHFKWQYSCQIDKFNNLLLFLSCHVPYLWIKTDDYFNNNRLYRVFDIIDNRYTFYLVTFSKYHHNVVKLLDLDSAKKYIDKLYGG